MMPALYQLIILWSCLVGQSLVAQSKPQISGTNLPHGHHLHRLKRAMSDSLTTTSPYTGTYSKQRGITSEYNHTYITSPLLPTTFDKKSFDKYITKEFNAPGLMALKGYHVICLLLTFVFNLLVVGRMLNRPSIAKKCPSVIPLGISALLGLLHVGISNAFMIANLFFDNPVNPMSGWNWCGVADIAHRSIVMAMITCSVLVCAEATYQIINPLTYIRKEKKSFILMASITAVIGILVSTIPIFSSFYYDKVAMYLKIVEQSSQLNADDKNVQRLQPGFMWVTDDYVRFRRCKRFYVRNTTDSNIYVIQIATINVVVLLSVIISFVLCNSPCLKKKSQQAVLQGKSQGGLVFTQDDLENNQKRVKSAVLATIVTSMPCILGNFLYAMDLTDKEFNDLWVYLTDFGFYTFINAINFTWYIVPWMAPLFALCTNVDLLDKKK